MHERILAVEDEVAMARVLASYLEREGFSVQLAEDGPTAVELAKQFTPTLIVLDVMLPGFDGFEACRRIRAFSTAYIIMLTARDEEADTITGLGVGADDYLVKPFSPRELVARIHAMLRRPRDLTPQQTHASLAFGDLLMDIEARAASVDGNALDLTRIEFDLLRVLVEHARTALTRRQLIDSVWGEGWFGDEHIVDVHIGHLRTKLDDDPSQPRFIRTVRGIGYGMVLR